MIIDAAAIFTDECPLAHMRIITRFPNPNMFCANALFAEKPLCTLGFTTSLANRCRIRRGDGNLLCLSCRIITA